MLDTRDTRSAVGEDAGMPRLPSDTIQMTARVPSAWVKVADEIAAKLSRPGLPATRADAYRVALLRGFEELRREMGLPPVEGEAEPKTAPKKPKK